MSAPMAAVSVVANMPDCASLWRRSRFVDFWMKRLGGSQVVMGARYGEVAHISVIEGVTPNRGKGDLHEEDI